MRPNRGHRRPRHEDKRRPHRKAPPYRLRSLGSSIPSLPSSSVYKFMPRNNNQKKRYYAVARGRSTGIFTTWEDCQAQVNGYVGNKFKGFTTQQEALRFLRLHNVQYRAPNNGRDDSSSLSPEESISNKRPCLDHPPALTANAASAIGENDKDSPLSRPGATLTPPAAGEAAAGNSTTAAKAASSEEQQEEEVETLAVKTLDETLQERLEQAQANGQVIEIMSPNKPPNQQLPITTTSTTNTSLRRDNDDRGGHTTSSSMETSLDFGEEEKKNHCNNNAFEATSAKLQLVPKTNDRRVRITDVLNTNLSLQIKEADKRDQQAFPDATRRMQGDVPSLVLHNKFFCQGVRVGWPYPAILPPQRQMVNHVILGLKRGLHVVLESPTGTGKSAALLCSTLAWQRHHDKCYEGTPPKIYYCSRTHSQVAQMVASLKKTPYRPRMTVLGSRERLCIHREIKPRNGNSTLAPTVNANLACQIRVKNTERYRKKLLGQQEAASVYSDDNPPIEVPGDGPIINESEQEEYKRAKCPHYRQLTATRTASLAQQELAPSQTSVNCCVAGGEKTRLGASDIEDLVNFGLNPYNHRTAIYRNDPSEALGITLGKAESGECNVRLLKDCGPAAKEGTIKVGDLLRSVAGTDTRGLDAESVIQAVRSSFDPVELDVVRKEGRLVDSGSESYSRHSACPYYLSRALAKHAEIVFAPYNYLLDPKIREAMSLEMKNAVIVLDEAHNVEDTLRESGSGSFGEFELCDLVIMLDEYSRYRERSREGEANISEIAHELLVFIENLVKFMRMSRERFERNAGPSGAKAAIQEWEKFKTLDTKEFEEFYFGPTGRGVNNQAVGCKDFFHSINKLGFVENETLLQYATELLSQIGGSGGSDAENNLASQCDRLVELISKLNFAKRYPQHFYIACACRANGSLSYASGVSTSENRTNPHKIARRRNVVVCERDRCTKIGRIVHCHVCDGSTPKWEALLSIHLLTPSLLLAPIAEQCRSLIFASGSLAPLGSLCAELGLDPASDEAHVGKPAAVSVPRGHVTSKLQVKPPPLEASHVVSLEKQLRAISIGYSPDGSQLTTTYSHYKTEGFYGRLGNAIASVVEAIPRGGVLVFLPSYSFLRSCLKAWKPSRYGTTDEYVWERFEASKGNVVVEPMGNQVEFERAKQEYSDCIRQSGCALLLAVYRGKMSEGISFNDDYARGVICVGVPFPSSFDRPIKAKRAYNDEMRNLCGNKQLLPGMEWYSQQAYRAIAQALGRCIRHAGDYGTVILMDSRHCDDGAPVNGVCFAHRNLPQWMRAHVRNLSMYGSRPVLNNANPPIFDGYRGLKKELATFFKTAEQHADSVLDGFRRDLNDARASSTSTGEPLFDHTRGTWSQSG